MPDFTGKVAIITGASSGIGAATAEHLSSLGARVTVAGRDQVRLHQVELRCQKAGAGEGGTLVLAGDVCSEDYCRALVEGTVERFGRIDVLVNSAGNLVTGSLETVPLEEYDRQMALNARSVVCLSQLAVPHLLKTRGNIVNVSSITGMRSFPGILSYCMSKSAVDQLTRCSALELADRGVRVNAVNPGVIVTNIHRTAGMSEEQYSQFLEKCKTTHALGRPGQVMEAVYPIAFLASEEASFITGVTLPVDGGRGIMCPR